MSRSFVQSTRLQGADRPRGHTHNRFSRRHVMSDHGVGPHGGAVANGDTAQNGYAAADPHLAANLDGPRDVAGFANRQARQRA